MTTGLTHCCVTLLCVFQLELLSYEMGRDEAHNMCIRKIKNVIFQDVSDNGITLTGKGNGCFS